MDKTFRTVLLIFTLLGGLLIAVTVIALHNLNRAKRAANWVDHTRATLAELDAMVSTLQTADGAVRAYLLTNTSADQATYRAAFNELGERIEVARALIASSAEQIPAFEELENQMATRADLARDLLAAKRAGNTPGFERLLVEDDGGMAMFEIRQKAQQIRNHFIEELRQHDQSVFEQDELAKNSLFSAASLILLSLLGSTWFIRDDLKQRRSAAQLLQRSNESLETQVNERTSELQTANHELKTENLENKWHAQALDHQLRYNQRIIDSISDLVLVITKVGHISRINPAVHRHTGFDTPSLVNHPLSKFISILPLPDKQPAGLTDPIADALAEDRDLRELPVEIATIGVPKLTAFLGLVPLHDNDQVIGAVVTLRLAS